MWGVSKGPGYSFSSCVCSSWIVFFFGFFLKKSQPFRWEIVPNIVLSILFEAYFTDKYLELTILSLVEFLFKDALWSALVFPLCAAWYLTAGMCCNWAFFRYLQQRNIKHLSDHIFRHQFTSTFSMFIKTFCRLFYLYQICILICPNWTMSHQICN